MGVGVIKELSEPREHREPSTLAVLGHLAAACEVMSTCRWDMLAETVLGTVAAKCAPPKGQMEAFA